MEGDQLSRFYFFVLLPTCIFNLYQVGDEVAVVGVLKMTVLRENQSQNLNENTYNACKTSIVRPSCASLHIV